MINMRREKIIRRVGDSMGIIYNKEEQKILTLKIGDTVDVDIKKVKIGDTQ